MARFTTRVELHKANSDDYETLHAAMERQNFSRTIADSEGVEYHLPTAEYNKEGNYTRQQVRDSAQNAANETGKTYSILVTESAGRVWLNLPEV